MTDVSIVSITMTPEDLARAIAQGVRDALAALRGVEAVPSGDWIDAKGAAEILGVTPRMVTKMAAAPKGRAPVLASRRVGKLLRFRRADVLAILESE